MPSTSTTHQVLTRADVLSRVREIDDELTVIRNKVLKSASARGETTVSADVATQIDALTDERSELELKLARMSEGPATASRAYDQVHRVTSEARTYRPDLDRAGGQFLRDIGASFLGDIEAGQRLGRHQAEERAERGDQLQRSSGTGAFSGFVVPQYLTDLYAPKARAMRPFADVCNRHPLPETGMTVNIARITTGTSVALQASEFDAVSEQNVDDTLLSINVQTAAGQQTLSRQALERGLGVEDVTVDDLMRAHATTLDGILINQATTGLSAVSSAISYTDASPTVLEFLPKLHQGMAAMEDAFLGRAQPSHVVMSPRRWYWLQSQMVSQWPGIAQPNIPNQSVGTNNGAGYNSGVRGYLPNGLAVVTDANITTSSGAGTNEDEVYVVAADECHLWEDPNAPMFIRADQPKAANLGVLFVIYSYFAYCHVRYGAAQQKIVGTGLQTPSW